MIKSRTPLGPLHVPGEVLVVPCVWDAPSARAVTVAGAKLVGTTSAGVSWSFGRSDGETVSTNDVLRRIREITETTHLPVSVDVEEGYSESPSEVAEFVSELLTLGVGGINIEDGYKPTNLLQSKIREVVHCARKLGHELFVNARTDVYLKALVPPSHRVEEVIQRAHSYVEAGASGIFVPGVGTPEEIEALTRALPVPLNVMAIPGLPPLEQLERLQVQRLSLGPLLSQMAYKLVENTTAAVLREGQDETLFAAAEDFHVMDQGIGQSEQSNDG